MVTAILRAVEQDGTTGNPRHVTIVGACTDSWCRCIHVTTLPEGEAIYCLPEELEPVA